MSKTQYTLRVNVTAAPSDLPAWRPGMAQWQWKELSGSSMNGVNTTTPIPNGNSGPSSRINAYVGLTVDPVNGILYAAGNGGHQDYPGNEVLAANLMTDGAWSVIRQASASADIQPDAKHYLDGRAPSTHTYWNTHFLASRNRIFRIGAGFVWGTPVDPNMMYSYSIADNDWDGAGTYPNTTWPAPNDYTANGQAKDETTDDVYFFGGTSGFYASLSRFNAAAGSIDVLALMSGPGPGVGYYCPLAYDHTRGKAVLVGSGSANSGWVWTNDGGLGTWSSCAFTGAGIAAQNQYGAHYNASLDRIVVKTTSAGTVLLVHPTTFAVTAQSTTGGGSVPDAVVGVNSRFLYVPALKGYVYYPAYAGNVWFLATEVI